MPLSDDTGRKGTEGNIAELIRSGYKKKQAVAIAMSHRKQKLRQKRGR